VIRWRGGQGQRKIRVRGLQTLSTLQAGEVTIAQEIRPELVGSCLDPFEVEQTCACTPDPGSGCLVDLPLTAAAWSTRQLSCTTLKPIEPIGEVRAETSVVEGQAILTQVGYRALLSITWGTESALDFSGFESVRIPIVEYHPGTSSTIQLAVGLMDADSNAESNGLAWPVQIPGELICDLSGYTTLDKTRIIQMVLFVSMGDFGIPGTVSQEVVLGPVCTA